MNDWLSRHTTRLVTQEGRDYVARPEVDAFLSYDVAIACEDNL